MSPSSLAADNKYIIPARDEFRASSFRISGRREKSPSQPTKSLINSARDLGRIPSLEDLELSGGEE